MWIKGLKSEVTELLQVVSKAVRARTTLPILSGIFLEAKNGKLKAFSTDLEFSLIKEIGVNVLGEGKTVIPARYFMEVVKNLPEGVLEMKVDAESGVLNLVCQGSDFIFKTLPAEEFPREPEKPEKGAFSVSLDSTTLSNLLQSVVKSASKGETRADLRGVLIKAGSGCLEACATDTYRLALRKVTLKGVKEEKEAIVPAVAVEEVIKLLDDLSVEAKLTFLESQLLVETEAFTGYIRLIEGQFPNYQGLIPGTTETEVETSREELLEALKRLQVFSEAGTVEFRAQGEKLSLAASSQVVGKGLVELEAEIKGPEVTLGFNSTYLQDGLRAVKGEKVRIGLQTAEKPALLTSPEDENFFYLVMPVRIPY